MKTSFILLLMSLPANSARADDLRPFSLGEDPPPRELRAFGLVEQKTGEPVAEAAAARRTQWLMFTADWCPACVAARGDFEEWLKRGGWQIDESAEAHVRLIDADRHGELIQRWGIREFPTFILIQDGHELFREPGYPGRMELIRRYQSAVENAPRTAKSVSLGTAPLRRDQVAQWISVMRPLLGSGGTLTIKLDRTQPPTAVLPFGDRLSLRCDNPLVMNYTLRNDVLSCRFSPPYPRGRLTYGLPIEQSISAISLSVSEVVLELPHAPDVRFAVER